MSRFSTILRATPAYLVLAVLSGPANATAARTFVSGQGADAGSCPAAAPCRTFAFALAQTNAAGEIDVLDPADYGPVIITKAISIVSDSVGAAGIQSAAGGQAITISAGASDAVQLRGLTIDGAGVGGTGIILLSGGNLEIVNCVVRNFAGNGINIKPSTSAQFLVSGSIVDGNAAYGIIVLPLASAVVTGVIDRVVANGNKNGITVYGSQATSATLKVTITDSIVSNNSNFGIYATSLVGHAATNVLINNSVVNYNNYGVGAWPNTILRIDHVSINGNGIGINKNTGTIYTYGNNGIDGNATDNIGALTNIVQH